MRPLLNILKQKMRTGNASPLKLVLVAWWIECRSGILAILTGKRRSNGLKWNMKQGKGNA